MVIAASYTGGITYVPTHLGPATMVAGCLFLAALATLWPDPELSSTDQAQQWFRVAWCLLAVLMVFAGLGYRFKSQAPVSEDLYRYAHDVEREFNGLPADRVLADYAEWIYLRNRVLMKDRAAILTVHREPHFGLIDRLRNQEYARILVHNLDGDDFAYDRMGGTGVRKALLENYREVRRIRGVRGMENWLYYGPLLSEVFVLEPIGRSSAAGDALSTMPAEPSGSTSAATVSQK
jgi:hypothetical protein